MRGITVELSDDTSRVFDLGCLQSIAAAPLSMPSNLMTYDHLLGQVHDMKLLERTAPR